MFELTDEQMIYLSRGDTCSFTLTILTGNNLEGYRYIIKENDEIYLGVTEANQCFENAILKKKYTIADVDENGDVVISFSHNDTKCLEKGTYYYTIKLVSGNDVETVVSNKRLFII